MDQSWIVRSLYEDCINARKLDEARALMVPELRLNDEEIGFSGWRAAVVNALTAFPEARFVIDDLVGADDRVSVRWHFEARQLGPLSGLPPTGKTAVQRGIGLYRIQDGLIAEYWQQIDRLGVLQQLGATIAPAPPQD